MQKLIINIWHHNKYNQSSYLKYLDINNPFDWVILHKLPVNGFKSLNGLKMKVSENVIMKKVKKDIFSSLVFNMQKNCINFIIIYHFYQKRWKFKKLKNLFPNLHNKNKYVIHIKNLKQALNQGLILKKVHRVINFHQETWLKSYIRMSTELKKKSNKWFWKRL